MTITTEAAIVATDVMAADGRLHPGDLGIVLPHEHLLLEGWDHTSTNYFNSMYMELVHFSSAGGHTIVDGQPIGRLRDPEFSRRLAAEADLKVIIGTGYAREAFLPPRARTLTVDGLAERLMADLTEGVDGSDVRAGAISNIEVTRRIAPTERRTLAAGAIAQKTARVGLGVRFDIECDAAEYFEVLDILEGSGADLRRVAVFGLVPRPRNLELFETIASRGCFLGFDLFGQDHRQLMGDLIDVHPEVQASSIKGFINRGLADRLLLSQGIDHIELMWVNGGFGVGHLLRDVVPLIRRYRVGDDVLDVLLRQNPRIWLAGA